MAVSLKKLITDTRNNFFFIIKTKWTIYFKEHEFFLSRGHLSDSDPCVHPLSVYLALRTNQMLVFYTLTNERPVLRSRDLCWPIRAQYHLPLLPPGAPGRPDVRGAEAGRRGAVDQGVLGVQAVNQSGVSIISIDQSEASLTCPLLTRRWRQNKLKTKCR